VVIEDLQKESIRSVDEYALRSALGVKMMKALALCGAFESLADNRRSHLWHSLAVHDPSVSDRHWGHFEKDPVSFDPLDAFETVDWDYSGSLHSTRGHPLESIRDQLADNGLPSSDKVRGYRDGSRCAYAGLVICRQRPGTANGVIFMTLEDEMGFVNLVVWQKVYERFRDILLGRALLGVRGKIQSRDGTVHLIVEECFEPEVNHGGTEVMSRDFR
jgi:error-prone DNA polymerase